MTPENQLLQPACDKIVEGIDQLQAAITERIHSRHEWTREHIRDIQEMELDLVRFKRRVQDLSYHNR